MKYTEFPIKTNIFEDLKGDKSNEKVIELLACKKKIFGTFPNYAYDSILHPFTDSLYVYDVT